MPERYSTRDSLSVKIIEAVAERDGTDMMDLPPLAATINPDALNTLFDSIEDPTTAETRLSLEYCNHTVRIGADRSITIE